MCKNVTFMLHLGDQTQSDFKKRFRRFITVDFILVIIQAINVYQYGWEYYIFVICAFLFLLDGLLMLHLFSLPMPTKNLVYFNCATNTMSVALYSVVKAFVVFNMYGMHSSELFRITEGLLWIVLFPIKLIKILIIYHYSRFTAEYQQKLHTNLMANSPQINED